MLSCVVNKQVATRDMNIRLNMLHLASLLIVKICRYLNLKLDYLTLNILSLSLIAMFICLISMLLISNKGIRLIIQTSVTCNQELPRL